MRGGWEGLAKIKILFSKVLRFRPLRNKRNKEKDKKRDPKNLCMQRTEPNRTNPNPNRTKRNEPDEENNSRNKLDEEDGWPK